MVRNGPGASWISQMRSATSSMPRGTLEFGDAAGDHELHDADPFGLERVVQHLAVRALCGERDRRPCEVGAGLHRGSAVDQDDAARARLAHTRQDGAHGVDQPERGEAQGVLRALRGEVQHGLEEGAEGQRAVLQRGDRPQVVRRACQGGLERTAGIRARRPRSRGPSTPCGLEARLASASSPWPDPATRSSGNGDPPVDRTCARRHAPRPVLPPTMAIDGHVRPLSLRSSTPRLPLVLGARERTVAGVSS